MTLNEDNKAWMILSADERMALKLNLGLDKSTWQASEIMGKSHYKYLEILSRAKKMFKIFSDYFETYEDNLIPEDLGAEDDFIHYIESVITFRMKVREATNELKNKTYKTQSGRDAMVTKNIQYLHSLNSLRAEAAIELIKEFDRWNNFRILPGLLQEPHAFKRRNKKRVQKYINNLLNLDPWVISTIKQRYAIKTPNAESLYFPLPLKNKKELSKILYIRRDALTLDRFTDAGLFLFNRPETAMEFLNIVIDYFTLENKHCKDGQIFWPRLRIIIQSAVNYSDVERIAPNRKLIEDAHKNLDKAIVRNYQKKTQKINFEY